MAVAFAPPPAVAATQASPPQAVLLARLRGSPPRAAAAEAASQPIAGVVAAVAAGILAGATSTATRRRASTKTAAKQRSGAASVLSLRVARGAGATTAAPTVSAPVAEEVQSAAAVLEHASSSSAAVKERAEQNLLNNYGKRDLVFTHGEGSWIYDADGEKYLDFTSGIAVNCLGHSDPGWAEAVAKQAGRLCHTSNMFLNPEQVQLGESLVNLSFASRAFFCNSGAEANEAAIKFARKYHFFDEKPREKFVAFENSFHGRTMGALALTWKSAYKIPFQPIMPSVDFLKYNDTSSLDSIDESTCAVFVEPMQGEGGVLPGNKEFLAAVRKRCDEVGALLVFDEVQCGLGRSGHVFCYERTGVVPDMLTLAKPLAGGLPIGAVLLNDKVAPRIAPGDHGSTFAGAPLVCAAANYTLGRVSDEAFLANVRDMGKRLKEGLRRIAEPRGLSVRGEGLLVGVVFEDAEACGAVHREARAQGLLVLTAGAGNVLRIAPALTVGASEVDEALKRLDTALGKCIRA
eukprot:TRINITY_DN28805_c0_g1_i2.p1 TRINITY_DN28805_c0_g1~~TRINITY_DN28805_c0_g1_i2.p1  ORF type:complete len:542 (-),score=118.72 TRINITY_DN28805_c0_g1_i2:190-1746(-)